MVLDLQPCFFSVDMNSNVDQDWLDCLKRWSYVALGDKQVIQFGGSVMIECYLITGGFAPMDPSTISMAV